MFFRAASISDASIEFRYIVSLLRESLDLEGVPEFDRALKRDAMNWTEFERLLVEHRVLFPVWLELGRNGKRADLPTDCRERLSALFKHFQLRQMRLVVELLRIVKAFDEAEIPYVTLKGPALSQWLYGDPVKRHCNDLDILVDRENYYKAERVLSQLGVIGIEEPFEQRNQKGAELWGLSYHRCFAGSGFGLEVHWRLSGIDCFYPVDINKIISSRKEILLAGYPVSIIGNEYMVDYLTLHGSAHCWNRLKWIYELACIRKLKFNAYGTSDQQSEPFSGNRVWCNQLLDCLFGADFQFAGCPQQGFATKCSLAQLFDQNLKSDSPSNVLRRTIAILWTGQSLRARWKYIVQLFSWRTCYKRFPLPESLAFLYLVIGPVYWFYLQVFGSKKLLEK